MSFTNDQKLYTGSDIFEIGPELPTTNLRRGRFFFCTDPGNFGLFIYLTSWETIVPTVANPIPPGAVEAFAGSTIPSGWLLCAGQSIAVASFPALFAVIGYTYGGAGANFNVPDIRGRAIFGRDDMGGSPANRITLAISGINGILMGGTGGTQAHTLIIGEMPSHGHTVNDPGHSHGYQNPAIFAGISAHIPGAQVGFDFTSPAVTGISINPAGGGAAHQNTPPAVILNYMIKT